MKKSSAQSATSLRRAPEEDLSARTRQYVITMVIRTACVLLAVLIQPYSWYTWLFAAGAAFLPYIAVVFANVGEDSSPVAVSPERSLSADASGAAEAPQGSPAVIKIQESSAVPSETDGAEGTA